MSNEFGDFDIIGNPYRKGPSTYAKFKCRICGREKDTVTHRMKGNNTGSNNHEKSCLRQDEIERRKENINNNNFGDFVLLKDLGNRSEKDRHKIGLFKCKICGREKEVKLQTMAKGVGTSHMYCIINDDVKFTAQFKSIFNAMKNRCNNPKYEKFHRYGGRGIKCDYEYLIDFYDDFYDMYLKHVADYGANNTTVERINTDGNYTKDNIRFATYQEQARNTSSNRSIKITDISNGYNYYFNSIGYGAEYLNLNRSSVDYNLLKSTSFPLQGKYQCEYYDNEFKPIIEQIKLKPLIEFY